MQIIRRTLLAALLCISVSGCDFFESKPVAKQEQPFKVAFNTWLGYSPLVIAKERGFLKKRGLDVQFSFIEGIGEKNAALLRGDIDGVGHTADSAVTSNAAGVDGQIVYVFDESYGSDGILASKAIKSVSDLRGKRVALEPGFTGHFFILSLLEEANLNPSDIQTVAMDTGSAGSAFVARKVDAAATWQPWLDKAKDRSDGRVLVTSRDRPGLIIDVLFMARSTIQSRPDDVRGLVDAMDEAIKWYRANPAEGDAIMAKFWKLPIDETKSTVAGVRFLDKAQNASFFGTPAKPGQLLRTVEGANRIWSQAGVIKRPLQAPGSLVYYDGVTK